MFKLSDFKVRKKHDYPYFNKIIQSWYSPILAKQKNDDDGYSACITIGLSKNSLHGKNELMLASVFSKIIQTSTDLIKHVECLRGDYLNKGTTCVQTPRSPSVIIFESEMGRPSKVINRMKVEGIFRFYPEVHGGADLEDRIHAAKPYVGKVMLTNMPESRRLRPDDEELVNMLLAYPANRSFAIASAYTQAILYAQYAQLFGDDKPFVGQSPPKHEFY